MTEAQKKLRDQAAEKHRDGLPSDMFSPSNQLIAYHKFIAGHDFAFERAKVLERALEEIAGQDYRGNQPPGMREARAALAEYRGSDE